MTLQELRAKTTPELQAFLKEEHAALLKLHLQREARELKNVRSMRISKKTIARILTLLQQQTPTL